MLQWNLAPRALTELMLVANLAISRRDATIISAYDTLSTSLYKGKSETGDVPRYRY